MCPGFFENRKSMNDKKEIRKEIRRKKQSCPKEQLEQWSQEACLLLEQTEKFRRAHTVLLYYALPDEVDTAALIRKYSKEKRILLPVVSGDDLIVRPYSGDEHLSSDNPYGIPEPTGPEVNLNTEQIDLAVVPGMAFTRDGGRLGRGKGFYDRLLSRAALAGTHRTGICFPFQLLPQLPVEPHDILMHEVVCPADGNPQDTTYV